MSPVHPQLFIKIKGAAGRNLRRLQGSWTYRAAARRLIGRCVGCRIAGVEDIQAVARFYGTGRENPFEARLRQIEEILADGYILIACRGGRIVGAAAVRRSLGEAGRVSDWWLSGMQVDRRYRGAGIGERLTRLAVETAKGEGAVRINLMVFENNEAAIKLYSKLGFCQNAAGIDRQPAADGDNSQRPRISMTKNL